eukprot:Nk52_evm10s328 gene=Nk52_evmTU10s328
MTRRRSSEAATFIGRDQGFSFSLDDPHGENIPSEKSVLLPKTLRDQATPTWGQEVKETWLLAYSVILSYLLQIFPGMVNVVFLGHLGVEALGASTLATMYINVTGLSLGLGLATAMDTLCSQAYGANNKKMLGVILQRGILILGLISIPIFGIWLMSEEILLATGQKESIAALSAQFIKYSIPGLFPMFLYELMEKYLQTQGIVKPSVYIVICSNIWNVCANWLFIYGLGWGFIGAPIARVTCNWVQCFLMFGYIRFSGVYKETWDGWSKQSLEKWGQFLSLAVPGMLMTCSEWWAFEVLTIAAGIIGPIALNAQSIALQVISFSYMTPLGIAVATTIRVGRCLGAGDGPGARRAGLAGIILVFFTQCVISLVAISLRFEIPKIYTKDADAIVLAGKVLPVVCGFLLFDGIQGVASGVLRGCGRQKTGALLNTICYYFVGIPLGLFFAFTLEWNLAGIWSGMFVGLLVVSSSSSTLVLKTDWDVQVQNALKRVGESHADA